MLASINMRNGTLLNSKSMLAYGLAGIALIELSRMEKITFDGKRVSAGTSLNTGVELLDDVMNVLAKKTSARKTSSLIYTISYKVKRFSKRILEGLEDSGFIRIEQGRFLGLIPYDRYIISRVGEYEKLVKELKDIVLKGDKKADSKEAVFISMLYTCSVFRRLLDKEERKQVKDTLKKIGKTEFFETLDDLSIEVIKAVKAIITAAQAAAA